MPLMGGALLSRVEALEVRGIPFLWHTFLVVRLLSYLPCLSCGIPFLWYAS